jgi:DNA-binding beta-propeller fold protein YncE
MILSITLLAVQVISAIPDAQIKLKPVYLSSQQESRLKLSGPAAMAVARSGNIYVFDDGNSRVVRLDSSGKFIAQFGQPGNGPEAIERAGLNDSIAVDENENVYVSDPATPKVLIFSSDGTFQRSFRVPFPMTSIAVNKKREIFLTADMPRSAELIYVFSETGKFLRRFGEKLIKSLGNLARNMNIAVAACDANDNLFVAFRSWPLIRRYSPEGKLISENQFTIPAELVKEAQRKYYSLEFVAQYPDSSFMPPLVTHSISISATGTGYLLLNAHSVVAFAPSGKVTKQFRFRAPRDRDNVFIRLVAVPKAKAATYLLDTRSGEIYETSAL